MLVWGCICLFLCGGGGEVSTCINAGGVDVYMKVMLRGQGCCIYVSMCVCCICVSMCVCCIYMCQCVYQAAHLQKSCHLNFHSQPFFHLLFLFQLVFILTGQHVGKELECHWEQKLHKGHNDKHQHGDEAKHVCCCAGELLAFPPENGERRWKNKRG